MIYFCIPAIHAHHTASTPRVEPESTTAGILSPTAGTQQKDIHSRLGPKVAEVSSTTGSPTVISTKSGNRIY